MKVREQGVAGKSDFAEVVADVYMVTRFDGDGAGLQVQEPADAAIGVLNYDVIPQTFGVIDGT